MSFDFLTGSTVLAGAPRSFILLLLVDHDAAAEFLIEPVVAHDSLNATKRSPVVGFVEAGVSSADRIVTFCYFPEPDPNSLKISKPPLRSEP